MNLQAEIDKNKQLTLEKVSTETLQTMQQVTLSPGYRKQCPESWRHSPRF
jgi:hypothetical protein